jgi:hypothetical protein
MSEDTPKNAAGVKQKVSTLTEEIQTKGIYVALAILFVADSAGVFAESVPSIIFVALFLVAVGIDAYS